MNRSVCLAAVVALAIAGARAGTDSPWRVWPINGGGFVQKVQIAASDPNVWYAYVDVGGPYRSDDAGKTWRPLHQNMNQNQRNCWADHIASLLVDPRDANRIVFASGWRVGNRPAGVYVSRDGGRTFYRTLKANFHGEGPRKWAGKVLARDPANPDVILAASDADGIFRSSDGGETWTSCGADDHWFVEIAFDKAHPGRAYASAPVWPNNAESAGSTKTGFLQSDDSGRTWRTVAPDGPFELAQAKGRDELVGLFLAAGGTEVRLSRDSGASWTDFAQGLVKSGTRYQALAAGTDFYVTFAWDGRMFRREVGADSWRAVPIEAMTLSHPEKEDGVARSVAAKCRECTSDVTIDPRDENHILTTDWFHIWQTFDGGRTWRTATDGMQQLVPFTVACDPHSPDNISYGCADMGMFNSQDGGRSFKKEHGICGANSIAFSARTKGRGYAVGGKCGIQFMITEDGGAKWRYSKYAGLPKLGQKAGEHGIYTVAVDPLTDDVYVCVSGKVGPGKGGIYRSKDGGDAWTWAGNGLSWGGDYYKPTEFAFGGPALWPEQLVFGPDGSAVTYGPVTGKMYWFDRAKDEWVHVNVWNKGGKFTLAADPHRPGRFLLATEDHLTELTEGGRKVSWYLKGSQGLGYALAFDPFTPGLVVASSADAEDICLSRDGGRHWTCLTKGMEVPTGTQHKLVVDRKRLFVLTRGSGVWTRNLD